MFYTVDQDCQLKGKNGKEIPTLLIRINKVEPRTNKVGSQFNKVGHRIIERVDPNQKSRAQNQQSGSRILYGHGPVFRLRVITQFLELLIISRPEGILENYRINY